MRRCCPIVYTYDSLNHSLFVQTPPPPKPTLFPYTTLFRSQPLTLDARDSGTGGHRVVWTAAQGARPLVSGGVPVTGWTKGSGGIWSAPVPAGLHTRQLYVNGVRANRASGTLPTKITATTAKGYTTADATMDNWRNPKDIEFVYTGGLGGWTEPRCPVAAISPTAITMAQPCWSNTND